MIPVPAVQGRNIRNVAGGGNKMEEYSRILIEDYCTHHDSAKSRRLARLVKKSYNIYAQYTDSDGIFVEKCIEEEGDPKLREAFKDLDKFMFGL